MFREMRRTDKKMSLEDTISLLEKAQVGVLSTVCEDGYPYSVAVNYIYEANKIYFHCAKSGHKLDNIKANDKVSFLVYDDVLVIGEELNTKYQSVVIFGKAKKIEASSDILMKLIKKYSSIDYIRANEMIEKEFDITALVEIEIEHITGKRGK